jgi:hypothetical protein
LENLLLRLLRKSQLKKLKVQFLMCRIRLNNCLCIHMKSTI